MASALEIFQSRKRQKITRKNDVTLKEYKKFEQKLKKKLVIKIAQSMDDNYLDIKDIESITRTHHATVYSMFNSLLNNKKIEVTIPRLLEMLYYLGVTIDVNVRRRGPTKSPTIRKLRRII